MERQETYKFLFIAAILQIVWGLVPNASKLVIEEIPVELYIALRWSLSGTIFTCYLIFKKSWKRVQVKDLLFVSLLGILAYGIGSFGTLYGIKIGGVTNFALMGALSPAIVSVVSIFMLREHPTPLFYFALPLSILGLLLLVIGKFQISSLMIAGTSAALVLGAFILEAFVFAFSKRFKERMSTAQYLATAQISTAVFMWGLQMTNFQQIDQLANLSHKGIVATIFVSVVACVLCYAILYWLLNFIDGHRLALFDGFHTLSAVLCGYFLFSESLTPLMLLGGGLILLSLCLGNLSFISFSRKQKSKLKNSLLT